MSLFQKRLLDLGILYSADSGGGDSGGSPPVSAPASDGPKRTAQSKMPQAIPMGEGSEGKEGTDGISQIRESIKETSAKLPQAEKNPLKNAIPYFEGADDDGGEPDAEGSKKTPTPKGEPDPAGDTTPAEGDTDSYYAPEVHAKDKDVYPNSYKTRLDAEYAIAQKIDRFEQFTKDLKEVNSEIGSTVPAEIQERIDKYKDVTNLADVPDDELRDFIVDLDLSLKSADEKHKTVSAKFNQSQKQTQVSERFKTAETEGRKAAEAIGRDFQQEITALPETAKFEDLLALADNHIQKKLEPINEEISAYENNQKLANDKGHKEWLEGLRELEQKREDRVNELNQARQKLIEFNDARVERDQFKSKEPVKLTDAQRFAKMDDVYSSWADDRSTGQFALEMFSAPTTDPILHFRKFSLAPANVNKFDLTTKAGWDKMHSHWKQTMNERFKNANNQPPPANNKRQSAVDKSIPAPPIQTGTGEPMKGAQGEIESIRQSIRKTAQTLYN